MTFVSALVSFGIGVVGFGTGGIVSVLWCKWSLKREYERIKIFRKTIFNQLLLDYDKKIEYEELLEEIDDWIKEYEDDEFGLSKKQRYKIVPINEPKED